MSVYNAKLDPVTANSVNNDITLQEKIKGLHAILESSMTGMLTTRDADGRLRSRAMVPCSPYEPTQVNLYFIANNASHKCEEIKHDSQVNVSFYDNSTTSWASFVGVAKVTRDKDLIKKFWFPMLTSYFGDLNDGVHHGNEDDPRVSIIEVVPTEIRYWVAVCTAGGGDEEGIPGELRIMSSEEIELVSGLNKK